ncbi:calcium-binding protein [Shimia sp. SDUM112013]|uniref:calcium-binding protein n=1 Tax=Shimia sp. SDUM112013 TaxID=3136160 RepID=UPI0032ECD065
MALVQLFADQASLDALHVDVASSTDFELFMDTAFALDLSAMTFDNWSCRNDITIVGDGDGEHIIAGNVATRIEGNGGDDTLTGGTSSDTLLGGDGNDVLTGGAGFDSVDSGAHDDIVTLTAGNENSDAMLDGGADTDILAIAANGAHTTYDLRSVTIANFETLYAGTAITQVQLYADQLEFDTFRVDGASGTAFQVFMSTFATLDMSSLGFENWSATNGFTIAGDWDAENIMAGNVATRMEGHGGNDTLTGGNGADTLIGGDGDDDMNGGAGIDTVLFEGANNVDARLGHMYATSTAFGTDTLGDIENAQTGSGNDTVIGSGIENLLVAGDGNDRLSGWGGDDTLLGGLGQDTLIGGVGDDNLDGGDGIDEVFFTGSSDVNVQLGTGLAMSVVFGNDTLTDIENARTRGGNDTLTGSTDNNVLQAGAGDDFLSGWGGADFLLGERGNDTLMGGGGSDTLAGGTGADSLIGGTGRDAFVFHAGGGADTVADFANDVDRLRLDQDLWGAGCRLPTC